MKNDGVKGAGHLLSLLLLVLSLLMPLSAYGGVGSKEVFQKAAAYYTEGKYDSAIAQYEGLLADGVESGNLYYNLGNCYFKAGDLGRAILSYERASRSIPNDADLKANYEFVLSQVPNREKAQQADPVKRLLDRVFGLLTINGICVMLAVLYLVAIGVLIGRLYVEAIRRYAVLLVSVALLLFAMASYVLYVRVTLISGEAIVLKDKVEARYEPLDRATVFFTLSVGMKVRIQQAKDNWYKVSRPDGKHGWVSKELIGSVNH
ncbi:MAG: tetratricopeptide repeat protein [Nitrospirae bacterium]|nr:tetratricopeptide repeat protein [Nitrospirota bacterium]